VPGEVLVVKGVASQTAVEDADEPVGEGAEGLVLLSRERPVSPVHTDFFSAVWPQKWPQDSVNGVLADRESA
jgi:hypothetical protein